MKPLTAVKLSISSFGLFTMIVLAAVHTGAAATDSTSEAIRPDQAGIAKPSLDLPETDNNAALRALIEGAGQSDVEITFEIIASGSGPKK